MMQMSIFDFIQSDDYFSPIAEVARKAGPYWTTSKANLIKLCDTDPDIKEFSKAVKHEYSPYGCSGRCGFSDVPNSIIGWDLNNKCIKVKWLDHDRNTRRDEFSWDDFAREIADLIWSGDFIKDGE